MAAQRPGLTQALGPMKELFASAPPYFLAVAIVSITVAYVLSERFFKALTRAHPELSDSFKTRHLLVIYGGTTPAKFRYLNSKTFNSLQDANLRRMGNHAYIALAVYAVSFLAFLLSVLAWASARGP